MVHIVFALTDRFHLLDLAGPAQVFGTAGDFGLSYRLSYFADTPQVVSAQGAALCAQTTLPDLGAADVVMVPGWRSPAVSGRRVSERFVSALVNHHAVGGTVAAVCSGAFALGQAGLLNGRRCTTHHALRNTLARRFESTVVVSDVLYVTDGRVATSAGVSAGIDLALHLVATWHGPAVAAKIAREMVLFARANGNDPHDGVMLRHRSHLCDTVHRVQDVIDSSFSHRWTLDTLADSARVSARTLTRMFVRATGMTPLRYQQALRLEHAEYLIGGGSTVEAAARVVGFADARMLRRLRARAADSEMVVAE
ncbi:MAG TPA: AraC family transcriptional regulator [Candidatus Stackebrandtia excrementipullorum]|nr:AraC family transcriptional regulator [Candidatus Stackebrandtia excrementipullorum]